MDVLLYHIPNQNHIPCSLVLGLFSFLSKSSQSVSQCWFLVFAAHAIAQVAEQVEANHQLWWQEFWFVITGEPRAYLMTLKIAAFQLEVLVLCVLSYWYTLLGHWATVNANVCFLLWKVNQHVTGTQASTWSIGVCKFLSMLLMILLL